MENRSKSFEICLAQQLCLHREMLPQDLVKMCYQAAFGAEHLLTNKNAALEYLKREYGEITPSDKPLFEDISENICRIDLSAWKKTDMPIEWLFEMFCAPRRVCGSESVFENYLETVKNTLKGGEYYTKYEDFEQFLVLYREKGMGALHHSDTYRQTQKPAYRIVSSRFKAILPVLEKISQKIRENKEKITVVAIDGRAASGKSTLARDISEIIHASVIHMDDFFLPPSLRTEERLAQAGGNVHYERFAEQILPKLCQKEDFEYDVFDCSIMQMGGKRQVPLTNPIIVEGSYSAHPILGEYYDLLVFADVSEKEQRTRILERNGEKLLEMFTSRWIPMEERYFKEFSIDKKAHIRFAV